MTISVLLPYRDAAATVDDAIASTLVDLAPGDELVTIDDRSRDDSASRVARWASRDPRVVAIATPPGGDAGIVAALRHGLAHARHPYVGRMDADDITLPGRFALQRAALDADPALAVVATRVELFPERTPGMDAYVTWQNGLVTKADHANAIHVESPVCHPSTLLRRSALDAVGGFRDVPWPEDWDLWLRLHHAGHGIAKIPRVLVRWRRHASNVTARDPRCAPERLREARAHYLAPVLLRRGAPFTVWGAGQTGRRTARALAAAGARAAFFIDIDPRKLGRHAYGAPIVSADDGLVRAAEERAMVVVAVGERGARDIVRGRLSGRGLVEGVDFVCAA